MCPPSPHYYPPPPPPPPFIRNARRAMESQKIYTMHIIKNADTASPVIHSFPVDPEALPDVTLEHLRALSSEQLDFISAHISKLNTDLAASTSTPTPSTSCDSNPEEARESDYETPWVLEGVELPLEPKTVYVRAAEDVSPRRRRHIQPAGDVFGVSTWQPEKGPYKELVVVYSRNICTRGAWFGGYYRRRGSRGNLKDTVWKVESTPAPAAGNLTMPPPPPPPQVSRRLHIRERSRDRGYLSESEDEIVV